MSHKVLQQILRSETMHIQFYIENIIITDMEQFFSAVGASSKLQCPPLSNVITD